MPNPGLEPGTPAWKAEIIPIDQFGFIKNIRLVKELNLHLSLTM